MKVVNTDVLKRGYIILTTSKKPISAGVRKATKSDISHAMICVSRGSVMDSTSEGVHARNIDKMFYEDSCAIYILRTKKPLSEQQIDVVVNYARDAAGMPYSVKEAISSVQPQQRKKGSRKEFCSRMVARAYEAAGIKLVKNSDFCTPEDLKNSELLEHVENSFILLSDEEYGHKKKIKDTTEGMRGVINLLLQKIRKLDPSVQSLADIDELLTKRPELDSSIAKAHKSSGFLDYYRIELERFPWRYNTTLIVQYYHQLDDSSALIRYCNDTIQQHECGDFKHWEVNLEIYRFRHEQCAFETYRLLCDLYEMLCFYHQKRIRAASTLISLYGEGFDPT